METLPEAAEARFFRLKQEYDKRQAEQRLKSFVVQSWHLVEPGVEFVDNWHIDAICEHLEAVTEFVIRQLAINIPPRHMKSSIVAVFWPAWVWTTKPQRKFLFSSYNPALSVRDAVKMRNIVESDWYQSRWPLKLHPDQNEKKYFVNKKGGHRVSTSPGGRGTGEGGDYIVYDDPHKVKTVESEVQRKGVHEYWDNEMSSRANNPKRSAHVVIGQRTHEDDLFGHLEHKGSGYEKLVLPARYEGVSECNTSLNFEDPRTEVGELLWENRFDEDSLRAIEKKMDVYQVAGQMQQRPRPRDGTIFQAKFFRRRWRELPSSFEYVLNCWDLSFDDKETSAYNVGYALGLKRPNIYVLQETRGLMDFDGQETAIRNLKRNTNKCKEVLIEKAANGVAQASRLRKRISGVQLVAPVGSKEDRARGVQYLFKSENIIFPDDEIFDWVEWAIDEICSFGPKARYKDRVDALVHGIERLAEVMEDMEDDVVPVSFTGSSRHI